MATYIETSISDLEKLQNELTTVRISANGSIANSTGRLELPDELTSEQQEILDKYEHETVSGLHEFAKPKNRIDYSGLMLLLSVPGFRRIVSLQENLPEWATLAGLSTQLPRHPELFPQASALFGQILTDGQATDEEKAAIADALPEGLQLEGNTLSTKEGWS